MDTTRRFSGVRSELSLLVNQVASIGEILSVEPPYADSAYSSMFLGPIVVCRSASPSEQVEMDHQLQLHLETPLGSSKELKSAYYAFCPAFGSDGGVTAHWEVRNQGPMNGTGASNQLWLIYTPFADDDLENRICDTVTKYTVCELWNATYSIDLAWNSSTRSQRASYTTERHNLVEFPDDHSKTPSDMVKHAYSAFFLAFRNQIIGSLGWYEDETGYQHGVIDSPIQQNILLGSSSLDQYFTFNKNTPGCRLPFSEMSLQRRRDKNLAANRTIDMLIEELSANVTISILHNELYTYVYSQNILASL